jgi:hypothetical protein
MRAKSKHDKYNIHFLNTGHPGPEPGSTFSAQQKIKHSYNYVGFLIRRNDNREYRPLLISRETKKTNNSLTCHVEQSQSTTNTTYIFLNTGHPGFEPGTTFSAQQKINTLIIVWDSSFVGMTKRGKQNLTLPDHNNHISSNPTSAISHCLVGHLCGYIICVHLLRNNFPATILQPRTSFLLCTHDPVRYRSAP